MAVDYLRLSLTDRCNLNCIYCTPMEKEGFLAHDQLLRHEELARAAAAFVRAGVTKIRLTGGEPLVKKNIVGLVKMLRAIPGLRELALTTNGLLLPELAAPLREAGLTRLNISLDTLNEDNFKRITGSAGLSKVLDGIAAALAAGYEDTKLNMVVMRRINDGEVPAFARLSLDRPLTVRFIEFYPANARSARLGDALFTTAETKRLIEDSVGALRELPPEPGGGPARVYTLAGAAGKIGFISGRSSYFCGACNRMRMDCTGKVYPCLYSPATHDLKDLLRAGASDDALADYIKKIFLVKSKYRKDSDTAGHVEMSSLGG